MEKEDTILYIKQGHFFIEDKLLSSFRIPYQGLLLYIRVRETNEFIYFITTKGASKDAILDVFIMWALR